VTTPFPTASSCWTFPAVQSRVLQLDSANFTVVFWVFSVFILHKQHIYTCVYDDVGEGAAVSWRTSARTNVRGAVGWWWWKGRKVRVFSGNGKRDGERPPPRGRERKQQTVDFYYANPALSTPSYQATFDGAFPPHHRLLFSPLRIAWPRRNTDRASPPPPPQHSPWHGFHSLLCVCVYINTPLYSIYTIYIIHTTVSTILFTCLYVYIYCPSLVFWPIHRIYTPWLWLCVLKYLRDLCAHSRTIVCRSFYAITMLTVHLT